MPASTFCSRASQLGLFGLQILELDSAMLLVLLDEGQSGFLGIVRTPLRGAPPDRSTGSAEPAGTVRG